MKKQFIVLTLALLLCFMIQTVHADITGRNTVGGTEHIIATGYFYGVKVTLPIDAQLNFVSFYCAIVDNYNITVAVYADNGTLIDVSQPQISSSSFLWRNFSLTATATAGDYFLVFSGSDPIYYKDDAGSNSTWGTMTLPDFPNPASFEGFETREVSIYLDYSAIPEPTAAPTVSPTATPITPVTEPLYTILLIILMLINVGLLLTTKGWLLSGIVGLITFAITAGTLADSAVYAEIIFAPYMQVLVFCTALICMVTNARKY